MRNKFGALFRHRITVNGTIREIHTDIVNDYVRDYQREYIAEDMAAERYRSHTWADSSYASGEYDESNEEMRMAYESELQRMSFNPIDGITIREDESGHLYPAMIPPVYEYKLLIIYNVYNTEYQTKYCITGQTSLTFSEARIRVDVRKPKDPIDIVVK